MHNTLAASSFGILTYAGRAVGLFVHFVNHCLALEDTGSFSGWCTPLFPDWLWVRRIPFIEATAGTRYRNWYLLLACSCVLETVSLAM